jgi:hypothetical protein
MIQSSSKNPLVGGNEFNRYTVRTFVNVTLYPYPHTTIIKNKIKNKNPSVGNKAFSTLPFWDILDPNHNRQIHKYGIHE